MITSPPLISSLFVSFSFFLPSGRPVGRGEEPRSGGRATAGGGAPVKARRLSPGDAAGLLHGG